MLILLQPGIQPLGQFDMKDSDVSSVVGGEVAAFEALAYATDGYAADVFRPGPQVHLSLGKADDATGRPVWGLVDEGSSAGVGGRGYGTMFGQVIGVTAGQGTGIGSSGYVVVGPSTMVGSGKATLWTKPGLYGVTQDAWHAGTYSGASLNDKIGGKAGTGKLDDDYDGDHVAYFLGSSTDTSFVSTPAFYAGSTSTVSEHAVLYLVGCA